MNIAGYTLKETRDLHNYLSQHVTEIMMGASSGVPVSRDEFTGKNGASVVLKAPITFGDVCLV